MAIEIYLPSELPTGLTMEPAVVTRKFDPAQICTDGLAYSLEGAYFPVTGEIGGEAAAAGHSQYLVGLIERNKVDGRAPVDIPVGGETGYLTVCRASFPVEPGARPGDVYLGHMVRASVEKLGLSLGIVAVANPADTYWVTPQRDLSPHGAMIPGGISRRVWANVVRPK